MDHTQRGCGDIRYDKTEVLSPNATAYVLGGRTITYGELAGVYRMDNQLLSSPVHVAFNEYGRLGVCFFIS
jgi:hypothetical protein